MLLRHYSNDFALPMLNAVMQHSLASMEAVFQNTSEPIRVLTFDLDFAWLRTRSLLLGSLHCVSG